MRELPDLGFKLDIRDFLTVEKSIVDKYAPDKAKEYQNVIDKINKEFEDITKSFIRGLKSNFSYDGCRENLVAIKNKTEEIIQTLSIPFMEDYIVFHRHPIATIDGGEDIYRLYEKALELITELERMTPITKGRPEANPANVSEQKNYFIDNLRSLYICATKKKPTRTGGGSTNKPEFVIFCEKVIEYLNEKVPNAEDGHHISISVDSCLKRLQQRSKDSKWKVGEKIGKRLQLKSTD